ncbi:MAG TPA: alpha/beta hydrolase [Candidatus Binataceae bacterium]|jgi:pimeloyl-ACP methyl ester carboxylesterase|nr:alpha/beta hydrolase [Candidatus Binataceae bacterium]
MGNTFVLVHGAWHGAWCWAAVIRQLDKLGDRAFALDLPGHGASNINRAEATLAAYIDSVVRFIEERGLSDVVLAGHSLGGITISGVAQRISRRLKRVIYVNAIVPRDGQRAIDTLPDADALAARLEQVRSLPDPSAEVDEQMFRSGYIQDASRDLQDFVLGALAPEPVAPMLEAVSMRDFFTCGVPQSYLVCEDDISRGPGHWHPNFTSHLANPTMRFVKAGHEIMFTAPAQCARALHELAQS